MELKNLHDLIDIAKGKTIKRIAIAAAADKAVLHAVKSAFDKKLIHPVLVGNKSDIISIAEEINFDINQIDVYDEPDPAKASIKAVSLIKKGEAEILMKGLVSTAPLLKAVLDKENGLRKGNTLSHFALIESPYYHKLIGITDAAMNIAPDFQEKIDIINNAVEAYHGLGEEKPKVGIIGPLEVVNPKIESTCHAAMISKMSDREQFKNCVVDGPFAFDNAISKKAAQQKGISGEVAGEADILVAPDLNSGNILYKSLVFMGGAISAAVVMGATVPVVLTSRADTEKSKMMSISLAAAM